MDTAVELLSHVLDAAANINKPEGQLRRTTHDLRTRVGTCLEVEGVICEHLLRTVTNWSLLCNRFVT